MQLLQNCKHCWYVSIQMRYPLFQTTHLQILMIFEKLSKVDRNRSFYIFGISEYRNKKKKLFQIKVILALLHASLFHAGVMQHFHHRLGIVIQFVQLQA